jgi:uncharacterized protein (TIGR02246 family)
MEHIGRLCAAAALAALASCVARTPPPDPSDVVAIEALLAAQTDAWNRGDLGRFVAGYGESDRCTFIGGDGTVVRGRAALEARYRASYPEGRRGTLTFSDLDVRRVGPHAYVVLGRWALEREPDDPHGVFTLVFERGEAGLEIVHDHSSGVE